MIEAFHQIHSSPEQLIVWDILRCPSTEYLIHRMRFWTAKLSVFQVGIVNRLTKGEDPVVGYIECETQRLKGASVAFMAKAGALEHVKRNRVPMRGRAGINRKADRRGMLRTQLPPMRELRRRYAARADPNTC